MMKHLILGGARSGKSRIAEGYIREASQRQNVMPIYIATAQALDEEMAARIEKHRCDRESVNGLAEQKVQLWRTIESPIALGDCLNQINQETSCVLVDCMTLWLSNCLHQEVWEKERDAFLKSYSSFKGSIVLVSNEVGSGIVPMGELSRRFVDEVGWLHQELARLANKVSLVVAGLEHNLKDNTGGA